MIHFLVGADTYRIKARLADLRTQFLADQPAFNLHHQLADGLTVSALPPLFQGMTLLGGDRLIILEDIFSAPLEVKEALVTILKSGLPAELQLVVTGGDDFDKRQSLFKWLSKSAVVETFAPLTGQPLTDFVIQLAQRAQLNLSPTLVRQLITTAGNDLWRLDNEIKKLTAYAQAAPVTDTVISQLVARDPQDDIFAIMAALSHHQLSRANQLLADLVRNGEDPIGILAVLTFQVRTLLRVSSLAAQHKNSAAIIQLTGLHPFAVSRALEQSRLFSLRWLTSVYQLLVKIDWKIKQGDLVSDDALDWLIATLAGAPA